MLYVVLRDCASGVTGQLVEGAIVELDEKTADWLNSLGDPAVKPAPKKTEPPARPGA